MKKLSINYVISSVECKSLKPAQITTCQKWLSILTFVTSRQLNVTLQRAQITNAVRIMFIFMFNIDFSKYQTYITLNFVKTKQSTYRMQILRHNTIT